MAQVINLQVIIDSISNIFTIAFPISITLLIISKITNIFCQFVFGKEVKF